MSTVYTKQPDWVLKRPINDSYFIGIGIVIKSNKALTQLDSLKEKGLITEDDYEIKKKEITDR